MIQSLRLQHFRSYKDEGFEFEPGVNIIVGPNASGKTSLIESIMYSLSGSSYKGRDIDLVGHRDDWARIDVLIEGEGQRTIKLQRQDDKVKKTIEVHDQQFIRMPSSKRLPFVLFEPNHLLMFHGGPEMRREFVDGLLDQLNPEFATARRHYKRALMQRNSLLKRGSFKPDELFVWNLRLSDLGGLIASERQKLIEKLNQQLPELYEKIAGASSLVGASYNSSCRNDSYASDLLKKLENNLDKEVLRGHTLYGPHRDDIDISLHDHLVKETASRGETRTILLTLKIFEQIEVERVTGTKPILLLDDVFSELDGARRRHLTDFLKDHQVFITTTDADVVIQHFTEDHKIIALTRPEA